MRAHPEVRERTRQRFRVVLVDEYQDSNIAQFELLKELWRPETYLCVVGDDDQSIYRFRGAEVGNILSFPEVFPGTDDRPPGAELPIHPAHPGRRLRGCQQQQGQAREDSLDGQAQAGEQPAVYCLEDQEEEADAVLADCRRRVFGRHRHPLPHERAVPAFRETLPGEAHSVSPGRDDGLLFPGGSEGRGGVPFAPCQSERRGPVPPGRQQAGPGSRRGERGEDHRPNGARGGGTIPEACRRAAGTASRPRARAGLSDLLALLDELGSCPA